MKRRTSERLLLGTPGAFVSSLRTTGRSIDFRSCLRDEDVLSTDPLTRLDISTLGRSGKRAYPQGAGEMKRTPVVRERQAAFCHACCQSWKPAPRPIASWRTPVFSIPRLAPPQQERARQAVRIAQRSGSLAASGVRFSQSCDASATSSTEGSVTETPDETGVRAVGLMRHGRRTPASVQISGSKFSINQASDLS